MVNVLGVFPYMFFGVEPTKISSLNYFFQCLAGGAPNYFFQCLAGGAPEFFW